MKQPIHIVGIGAEGVVGLSALGRAALREATLIAGGKRQLELVSPIDAEVFSITNNLPDLVAKLQDRKSRARCVVLASGDPMCYGIGGYLRAQMSSAELVVEPAVSSMQLAFARAVRPWSEAALASIHGRPIAETLRPLLGKPSIGLFTQDGTSPAAVAEFFLQRGLDDYTAWVCEDLGTSRERITTRPLRELYGQTFRDLNFLILGRRDPSEDSPPRTFQDRDFAQPESGPVLLTHSDVRAVVLSRFDDLAVGGPIWDVGAGLGGIAVALARRFPAREVIAVEQTTMQLAFLHENRRRFRAYNIRIVAGVAPQVLNAEADPAAVFLGGSGGRLDGILDQALKRMMPGGVFVANFVGLENLSHCLAHLRAADWSPEVTQVQICRGEPLAGLTTFAPLRPVWVVEARRPEGSS